MSDFAQYPFSALQAVGRSLSAISEQLTSKSRGAFDVAGLADDQQRISGALDSFRREWEASLTKLGDNIGNFGELSTQIAALSGEFDAVLAQSLSPRR